MIKLDFIVKGSFICDEEKLEEIDIIDLEGMLEVYRTGAIKIVIDDVEVTDEDGDPLDMDAKEEFERGIRIVLLGEEEAE
jgi:hypothetical protein